MLQPVGRAERGLYICHQLPHLDIPTVTTCISRKGIIVTAINKSNKLFSSLWICKWTRRVQLQVKPQVRPAAAHVTDLENRQDSKGTEILSMSRWTVWLWLPLVALCCSYSRALENVTKGLIWFGKGETYFDTLLRKMSKVDENLHEDGSKLCLTVSQEPTYARQRCCQDLLDLES